MSDDLESRFWNGAINTYGEETKQLLYLELMGFKRSPTWRTQYSFDGEGKSYIDIGGGPSSVLLKFENTKRGDHAWSMLVVDPADWPRWVIDRYSANCIGFENERGEDLTLNDEAQFDVALIYNCLQHCESPEKVIANARAAARTLKMFEWIDLPSHPGHPHELHAADLDRWTGRTGRVVTLNGQNECYGRAWVLA